jgi:glutaredoxin 3
MKPILYVKQGCPWCKEALAYFDQKGLDLDIRDVRGSEAGMAELEAISGQTKTPTLKHGEFVVADFDIGEFEAALAQNPQAKADLGL